MYAQLGNIVFKELFGFDGLSDKRETLYVEHPLTNSKPRLEKVGEALIEFICSTSFHIGYCNPETEYKKLNDARIAGEILPFFFGNGNIEGNFVITSLERTINELDAKGNLNSITCNFTLKEYANTPNLEGGKTDAFAVSSSRPLPANPTEKVDNPSLSVMNENKTCSQCSDKVADETINLNNKVLNASTAPPISKAQAFVDEVPVYVQKINTQLTTAQVSLSSLTNLMSLYSGLGVESPTLAATVTSSQTAISALQTQNSIIGSLPTTISDPVTALSVLNELLITTNLTVAFVQTIKDLKDANSKIALSLAMKKKIT